MQQPLSVAAAGRRCAALLFLRVLVVFLLFVLRVRVPCCRLDC
jgi:hypothetical protein